MAQWSTLYRIRIQAVLRATCEIPRWSPNQGGMETVA